jgi:hypothetical protein
MSDERGKRRTLLVAWAIGAPLFAILVVAAVTVFRADLRFWARPDDGSDAQGAGDVLLFLFTGGLVLGATVIAGGLVAATTWSYHRAHQRN